MYHVSAQGIDERKINVHYYYNIYTFFLSFFNLKTQANLTEMFFVFYVLYVGMHDLSGD